MQVRERLFFRSLFCKLIENKNHFHIDRTIYKPKDIYGHKMEAMIWRNIFAILVNFNSEKMIDFSVDVQNDKIKISNINLKIIIQRKQNKIVNK